MPVSFKDNNGQDIEPGDTVRITKEVIVQTVEATGEGSVISYADRQNGKLCIACDEVEKIAPRP